MGQGADQVKVAMRHRTQDRQVLPGHRQQLAGPRDLQVSERAAGRQKSLAKVSPYPGSERKSTSTPALFTPTPTC